MPEHGADHDADEDRRQDRHAGDQQLRGDAPDRPRIDPTDRSIPAVRMTSSWPTAMIAEDGDLPGEVGQVVAGEELVAGQREGADRDQQHDQPAALPSRDVAQAVTWTRRRAGRVVWRRRRPGRPAPSGGRRAFAGRRRPAAGDDVVSIGSRQSSLGISVPLSIVLVDRTGVGLRIVDLAGDAVQVGPGEPDSATPPLARRSTSSSEAPPGSSPATSPSRSTSTRSERPSSSGRYDETTMIAQSLPRPGRR